MFAFILRRFAQAIIVMLVISVIGFSIKESFGDPVMEMVGMSVSKEEREAIREELGLNDPIVIQYFRFIGKAIQGDLGNSIFYKEPVTTVILKKLPATIELVIGATILIIGLSIPMGIFSAIKPKHPVSKAIMAFSTVGVSIPVFLTAIVLIYVFAVKLGWLPSFGRGELVHLFGYWDTGYLTVDGLLHLVMPSITLASIMLPLFIRLIRSEMLEIIQSEYIKFARVKGLPPWRVYLIHAFKNTLLPVITMGGLQIGIMVAYTILTETVFQWNGVGFIFLEAVNRSDLPLIVGYIMFVGLVFVIANTLVDLLYALVNPTVRIARSGA